MSETRIGVLDVFRRKCSPITFPFRGGDTFRERCEALPYSQGGGITSCRFLTWLDRGELSTIAWGYAWGFSLLVLIAPVCSLVERGEVSEGRHQARYQAP